jgi:hypothetical protein
MSEARFVKFVKGRYWLTLTETAEPPYRVFQGRHEAKVWLVQYGMVRSVARRTACSRLTQAHRSVCCLSGLAGRLARRAKTQV